MFFRRVNFLQIIFSKICTVLDYICVYIISVKIQIYCLIFILFFWFISYLNLRKQILCDFVSGCWVDLLFFEGEFYWKFFLKRGWWMGFLNRFWYFFKYPGFWSDFVESTLWCIWFVQCLQWTHLERKERKIVINTKFK